MDPVSDNKDDVHWMCVCSDNVEVQIDIEQFLKQSGYFQALYRSQVEEHKKKQVCLDLVSSKFLSHIQTLMCLIDSEQFELDIELQIYQMFSQWSDSEEMDEFLAAVDYLDMHLLRKFCDRYFCSLYEISRENLSYVINLCTRFSFSKLEKKLLIFLLKYAWDLKNFKSDIENIPFELLRRIIESKKANIDSEWDLIALIDSWFAKNANYISNEKIIQLCKDIRVPELLLATNYNKFIEKIRCMDLRNKIKTLICDFEDDKESYVQNHPEQSSPRRGEKLLLAMRVPFGSRLDRACSFSKDFNIEGKQDIVFNESRVLSSTIPCLSLREFCVCTVGRYVYVAGGQCKYSLSGQFALNSVFKLDLVNLEWKTAGCMKTERCLFYMDSISGHLFAVGGINEDGEQSSVEKYDTETDSWSYVQSLSYTIHEHAGCEHNKALYISGGHDGTNHVNTVSRYNMAANTWDTCAPMLSIRSCHTMTGLNNRLYVIGGSKIRKFRVYGVQSVECYSIASDQWSEVETVFPSIHTACLSVYAHPYSGMLLVLGGYSYKNHKHTLEMHRFREQDCKWDRVPVNFNSKRKDENDVAIIDVKVSRDVAEKLIRNRRSCTLANS